MERIKEWYLFYETIWNFILIQINVENTHNSAWVSSGKRAFFTSFSLQSREREREKRIILIFLGRRLVVIRKNKHRWKSLESKSMQITDNNYRSHICLALRYIYGIYIYMNQQQIFYFHLFDSSSLTQLCRISFRIQFFI